MEQNKEREDRRSQLEHGALVKKNKTGFRKEVHKTDTDTFLHTEQKHKGQNKGSPTHRQKQKRNIKEKKTVVF